MNMIRDGLPWLPPRMEKLRLDHRGFPVPWFVAWIEGKPDFRVIDTPKIGVAVRQNRCWLCGEPMGQFKAFVIGPMCAVNRIGSEPPSHRECAEFAIRACPFLMQPKMRRNEKALPDHKEAAGFGLKRNPGVTLVWITKSYKVFRSHAGGQGVLFSVGEPIETLWFAEGRTATRAEIEESISSGLPLLREPAEQEGEAAVRALEKMVTVAMRLLPKAA